MYSADTQLLTLDPFHPDPVLIGRAAERLRSGGLVSFPTETVYGLGANALDPAAVERVFEVKQRPSHDPLIVHIAALTTLDEVAEEVPTLARSLAESFWPGPLTLVLKRRPRVAANVSAGLGTVAVRMPDHKVPLALIEASGLPIAAPSANLFTRPSPTTAQHVLDDLGGRVDMVLDGGPCPIGLESTVLDLNGPIPTVLRPGGVAVEALRQQIPNLQLGSRYIASEGAEASSSPGMLAKHYSPSARFLLFTGSSPSAAERYREIVASLASRGLKLGVMTTDEDAPSFAGIGVEIASLGSERDLAAIGQNLFAQMRRLETRVDLILIRAARSHGLGLAIWDRLYRAAEQQVFDLDGEVDVDEIVNAAP